MQSNTLASDLHKAVAATCPIHGVSIGRRDDRATWRIDFAPEATDAQRVAAAAALAAFDPVAVKAAADAQLERESKIDAEVRRMAEAELIRRGEIQARPVR